MLGPCGLRPACPNARAEHARPSLARGWCPARVPWGGLCAVPSSGGTRPSLVCQDGAAGTFRRSLGRKAWVYMLDVLYLIRQCVGPPPLGNIPPVACPNQTNGLLSQGGWVSVGGSGRTAAPKPDGRPSLARGLVSVGALGQAAAGRVRGSRPAAHEPSGGWPKWRGAGLGPVGADPGVAGRSLGNARHCGGASGSGRLRPSRAEEPCRSSDFLYVMRYMGLVGVIGVHGHIFSIVGTLGRVMTLKPGSVRP